MTSSSFSLILFFWFILETRNYKRTRLAEQNPKYNTQNRNQNQKIDRHTHARNNMAPTNVNDLHTVTLNSMKGEDVVITGISARLPESENMEEFRQNLINKKDMITADDRRWEPGKNNCTRTV